MFSSRADGDGRCETILAGPYPVAHVAPRHPVQGLGPGVEPMTTTNRVRARVLSCAVALALTAASPVRAQQGDAAPPTDPPWALLNVVGYGGLGLGLGILAGARMPGNDPGPSGAALFTMAGMTIAGAWAGSVIGTGGARTLAEGRALGPAHRLAAVGGLILAGATLGALVSVPFIAPRGEETPLGSDETTFGLLAGGGAALGAFYATKQWGHIGARRLRVTPSVREGGQYSLGVRVHF